MRLSTLQRASLEEATTAYAAGIGPAVPYLQGRGLSAAQADTFRLGFVGDDNVALGDEDYVGRLAIPYITPSGVVDIRYRAIGDNPGPKYLSRPGAVSHLYNVLAFGVETANICVTEGEIDTIVAQGLCGLPSVGVPGANNWKDHFRLLFMDYDRVFVLCDGDQAGREFGKRLGKELDNAVIVHLPDGHDVNSLYLAEGQEAVLSVVGL